MSQINDTKKMAHLVLKGAQKRGIKDVKAVATKSRSVSVTYRKGRPDKVEESSTRSINLYLYDNGKYSACSSNDFRPEALDKFVDSAVAMTRAMTPDPYREITDPSLYAGQRDVDLKLYDSSVKNVSADQRNQMANAAEQAALEAAGDKAISAEANVDNYEGEAYQVHSNGFEGSKQSSRFSIFAEVSLKDEGDKRPSGWDYCSSRFQSQLVDAEQVGIGAAKRALQRMGAVKIETQKLPMIVENRTVGRLLSGLMAATAGRTLQQNRSFLEGKIGAQIGSEHLTLIDNPFIESGFGSRLFDGEGISAKTMPIFEKGIFKNYYIDTYYGKKLSMAPTTGGQSNLIMPQGSDDLNSLIKNIEKGILVRGFIGGNANSTTGDFSKGVYGTLIEKGSLTQAVSELNIAGNNSTLWKQLTNVGNDYWLYSSLKVPSLLFDEIQFSGN